MFADGLQVASEEAAFYVLLKPLQGGAIPALFGISSLKVPGAGLLVLELIEGMPLSDLDEITPEVAEAALDALAQVCAAFLCFLLHEVLSCMKLWTELCISSNAPCISVKGA